jgi:ribosome-associated protein
MQLEELKRLVVDTLDDMKALGVTVMDLRGKTEFTDFVIVASGTSERHVKSIAESVAFRTTEAGERPPGMEGLNAGEWAMIDLDDVVVHVMLPKVRERGRIENTAYTGLGKGVSVSAFSLDAPL